MWAERLTLKKKSTLMKQTLLYLTIAAACALGVTASAQETKTETPAADTVIEAPVADTATTDKTTVASEEEFPVASDEPQPGQLYKNTDHGPWELRCFKAPKDAEEGFKEVCHLFQKLADENGNEAGIIEIQRLADGQKAAAGVNFTSPLGSLLTAGVVMRIDSGKGTPYQYLFCDEIGCTSRFGLTKGQVASMRKGANGKITIGSISAPKKPINLIMSLSGFTAAWKALER